MKTRSQPVWILSFVLCLALAVTPNSVKADGDEHSGSSGGGDGAVVGLVLAGLIAWALFGRNAESKKNKPEDVKPAPTATDDKEKPTQKKGIGSNLDPEF